MITRPPQSQQAMRAELETALQHARNEAESIAVTAARVANAIAEAQEAGNTIAVDRQIHYLTGAFARLLKDLGVAEHLQRRAPKRRAPIKMYILGSL